MERYKYPKTPHLPWSESIKDDDIKIDSLLSFDGRKIIMTEKMDGENTTIYSDGYIHARSIDSISSPWQSWIKNMIIPKINLPKGWRICGENMFAIHSIEYDNLASYFYVFGIIDNSNIFLSWDETQDICDMLGLKIVPIINEMVFSPKNIKDSYTKYCKYRKEVEGYVIRYYDPFLFDHFDRCVAKYVRKNHVQTDQHWKNNWKPAKLTL